MLSQKKFGDLPEDYKKVHYLIDCSKYYFFHAKHRACLHNTYGVMLAEQLFGEFLMNSNGHKIAIRTIAEEHCREDLNGYVPSLEDSWQTTLNPVDNEWLKNYYNQNPTSEEEGKRW